MVAEELAESRRADEPAPIDELATALAAAQASFGPIPKGRTANVRTRDGGSYSYRYADLADILKALTPKLADQGLAIVQQLERRDGVCVLRTRLIHKSGQEIDSELELPSPASTSPQAWGSSLTYARRYALSALVGVAAEEDDDGQVAEPPPASLRSRAGDAPAARGRKITEKQRDRLFAIVDDTAARLQVPKDQVRQLAKRWIEDTGFGSSADLTQQPYGKLCKHLEQLSLTDLAKSARPAETESTEPPPPGDDDDPGAAVFD